MKNKWLLFLAAIFLAVFIKPQTTQAATTDWQQPVMTLGASLGSAQQQATIQTLSSAAKIDDYQQLIIDGDDLIKFLDPKKQTFKPTSAVYSSALIVKSEKTTGIDVKILSFNGQKNITTITADQYKNAALTAGISNATIYVTSATPIDGSGALAGVYAAYDQNKQQLNSKQIAAAQEEIKVLSEITTANQNKIGYSDAQLNNVVTNSKQKMAKKSESLTLNQIDTIVTEQIVANKLTTTVTTNQKQQLTRLLFTIQESGALKNKSFTQQANAVIKNIQSHSKDIFKHLNKKKAASIWEKIKDFFVNLFQ